MKHIECWGSRCSQSPQLSRRCPVFLPIDITVPVGLDLLAMPSFVALVARECYRNVITPLASHVVRRGCITTKLLFRLRSQGVIRCRLSTSFACPEIVICPWSCRWCDQWCRLGLACKHRSTDIQCVSRLSMMASPCEGSDR